MDPALIAAGASLLGTGVSAVSSGNMNRKNREWQEKMWEKTNEYNLPTNQMARFKAAGLNPHLIYGQGNAGNTTMPTAPKTEAPKYNFAEAAMAYTATKKQQAEIDNMQKAMEVMEADKVQKAAQTQNLLSNSAKTDQEVQQSRELFQTVKAQADLNLDMTSALLSKVDREIDAIGKQMKLTEAQTESVRQSMQESAARIKNMQADNNLKGIEIELKKIEIELQKKGLNLNSSPMEKLLYDFIDALKINKIPNLIRGQQKFYIKDVEK